MVGLGIDSRGRTDSQGLEVIEKQRYIVLPLWYYRLVCKPLDYIEMTILYPE